MAVALKGAPLMGMFKANRRPLSPEDEAALARLTALASRVRAAGSSQLSAPAPMEQFEAQPADEQTETTDLSSNDEDEQ